MPLLHCRHSSPLMHTFLFNARHIFPTSCPNYGRPVCRRAFNSLISRDFPLILFFPSTLATFLVHVLVRKPNLLANPPQAGRLQLALTKAANRKREKCNPDQQKPTWVCWPTWDGRIRLPCARLDGRPCHTPYRRGHAIHAAPSHHVSTLLQFRCNFSHLVHARCSGIRREPCLRRVLR